MTPQEVLEKAAAAIGEKGHAKGAYKHPNGSMCARGAIRYAATEGRGVYLSDLTDTGTREVADRAEVMLILELAKDGWRSPAGYSLVPTFNDATSTTAEDVMLMLKRAAHA